jgi:hypothetical protein
METDALLAAVMSYILYVSYCFSSFCYLQRYKIKKEKSRAGCDKTVSGVNGQ